MHPKIGIFISIKILFLPFIKLSYYLMKLDIKKVMAIMALIAGRWIGFILYIYYFNKPKYSSGKI